MSQVIGTMPCPKCREKFRDNRGDNLIMYADGGYHCFSCSYHIHAKTYIRKQPNVNENKTMLPSDCTREVPTKAWKWLLQYGLGYRYWQEYCSYSEKDERLVFRLETGNGVGRYFGDDPKARKWYAYGDLHKQAILFGSYQDAPRVTLVEDLISAHKVSQVGPCIPLFGTEVSPSVVATLNHIKLPVRFWLDHDQMGNIVHKTVRLSNLINQPVDYIFTNADPKACSLERIKMNTTERLD